MKLRATKTHCEGTGHLPHSAQVPDHLQAAQLPKANWPWHTPPHSHLGARSPPLGNGALLECCGMEQVTN